MTDCIQERLPFPRCKSRLVEARFSGGDITSNGGVLLLRQADRVLGLTERVAKALTDPRRKASCRHDALSIVRQRDYSLALGYEDLNDHDELRRDLALQTAVESVAVPLDPSHPENGGLSMQGNPTSETARIAGERSK